jgi:hypothetical protein
MVMVIQPYSVKPKLRSADVVKAVRRATDDALETSNLS